MNFYTSIFKQKIAYKQWVYKTILASLFISLFIFSINLVVDPYAITQYNVLDIKYKLARDDRRTKINFFKTQATFDNIILGSSRTYWINPRIASNMLGGSTYNFGIGSATVEDHLGILKYLQRENKLPKNIIVGLDFYTFNKDIPANRHFLINEDLNFLSYKSGDSNDYAIFFSIDALRASLKTLKHHFRNTGRKPSFDNMGWGGKYIDYTTINKAQELKATKNEISKDKKIFYTNYSYNQLDKKRLAYYDEIKKICKDNNIRMYVFNTPLHPLLLKELKRNKNTRKALKDFVSFLQTFKYHYNFYEDQDFKNYDHFRAATHTTTNAGDIILKKVLAKTK